MRAAIYALVPLLVLLAVGEVVARLWLPDVRGTTYFSTNLRGLDAYEEDRDLFWKMPAVTDELIAAARADRGRMLVTLGGSIAQGTAPRHFTVAVEENYRGRFPDLTVYNLALAGYTSHQSVEALKKIVPPARPRVVLVCNGFNDAAAWWTRTDREVAAQNRHWTRRVLEFANRSRLFSYARHAMLGVERGSNQDFRGGGEARVPLSHYRENLNAIADRVASGGGATVLVTQAMPSRRNEALVAPYFAIMAEVAAERPGVFFCDVRPRFAAERERLGLSYMEDRGVDLDAGSAYKDALFSDGDCHVTELGYALMAEEIARIIDTHHLLDVP